MTINNYTPGPNHVSEFQVSSNPWVTSSVISGITEYSFPLVTKFIVVKNLSGSATIKVGFTDRGIRTTSNYFTLSSGEAFSADFRLKSLFLSGSSSSVEVLAGLTGVPNSRMLEITASNGWSGVG